MGGIPTRLTKNYLKHNLQQPLQDILLEGYRLSRDPTWPTPNHIICQASLQEAIQQQAALGRKQLLYGRITGAWKVLLNAKAPQLNSNSFLSKIIHHSWMAILTIWQIRNMHLYPPNEHLTDCTQLYAIVENIFHTVKTNPTLSNLLSYTTINQIMQKSIREIRKWIKKSPHTYTHIKKGGKSEQHLTRMTYEAIFSPGLTHHHHRQPTKTCYAHRRYPQFNSVGLTMLCEWH